MKYIGTQEKAAKKTGRKTVSDYPLFRMHKTGRKTVGSDYPLFRMHNLSRDQAGNGEIKPPHRGNEGAIGWPQASGIRSASVQSKADASAWMDDIKAKIDKRADQRDANAAAKDADRAERDAADAIDYALWAFFSARLAVLDALDARAYADERAKIAGS